MVGEFERFNQAVLTEKELISQQKQIQPIISKEEAQIAQSKQQLRKQAKQQVLRTGRVDPEKVMQIKEDIREREIKVNELKQRFKPEGQIKRNVINQSKTPEQLQEEGFKKTTLGNRTIYFKEKEFNVQKGRKETFKQEEHVFVNDKKVSITKREDIQGKGKNRIVEEQEIVLFNENGTVKEFREFDDGEKQKIEIYDQQGRLTKRDRFNDEGKRTSSQKFKYNDEKGTVNVKTREFDPTKIKLSPEPDRVQVTATLGFDGTETITTTQAGISKTITTTPEQTLPGQIQKRKPVATKTRTLESQLKDTSNIKFEQPKEVLFAQTQTFTPEQLRQQQIQKAEFIPGRKITLSPAAPEVGEVNLNPGRIVTAPLIFGAETVITRGGNIQQGFREIKQSVQQRGVLATGGSLIVGTAQSVATDPFGAIGEGLIGGQVTKPFTTAIRRGTTRVEGVNIETTAKTIETSPTGQGLAVQQIDFGGTVDVSSGIFRRSTQRIEVEGGGIISSETRALGTPDAEIPAAIIRENQISTQVSPTQLIDGKIEIRTPQGRGEVEVSGIRQRDLQITTIDGQTTFTRTEPTIKLDDRQLFRSRTLDPATGDVFVTTSRTVESPGTTIPTKELFATAAESQTDVLIKARDLTPKTKEVFDIEGTAITEVKVPERKQIEFKDTQPELKIEIPEQPTREFGTSQQTLTPNQFQELEFETPQTQTGITSSFGTLGTRRTPETKITSTAPIQFTLPSNVIRNIVRTGDDIAFAPTFSFAPVVDTQFAQSVLQTDERSLESPRDVRVEPGISTTTETKERFAFQPVTDTQFDFDNLQETRQQQEQFFENPVPPAPPVIPPPPIVPKTPIVPKLDFDPSFKPQKKKKGTFDVSTGEGIFIASLGGLLTGQTAKNLPKTLTGLEIRGIIIKK